MARARLLSRGGGSLVDRLTATNVLRQYPVSLQPRQVKKAFFSISYIIWTTVVQSKTAWSRPVPALATTRAGRQLVPVGKWMGPDMVFFHSARQALSVLGWVAIWNDLPRLATEEAAD
jgi:hypothetical protein